MERITDHVDLEEKETDVELTKLEFFAGMALCGTARSDNTWNEQATVDTAIEIARRMIGTLEEEKRAEEET